MAGESREGQEKHNTGRDKKEFEGDWNKQYPTHSIQRSRRVKYGGTKDTRDVSRDERMDIVQMQRK